MKANYYDQILKIIKSKMQEKNYSEALKIIQNELDMPYIPREYQKPLENFLLVVKSNIKQNYKKIEHDQIINFLFSNHKVQRAISFEMLKSMNLRPLIKSLKKRFETLKENIEKAILFEIMADQEININLKINNMIINPKYNSIFNNKESELAFKAIDECNQSPQIVLAAKNQLYKYLLATFPTIVTNGYALGTDIVIVASFIITGFPALSLKQKKIFNIIKSY